MSLALHQELASLSLLLKYEKKCLELAYELTIAGALNKFCQEVLALNLTFQAY
jgi:hypothetical protein